MYRCETWTVKKAERWRIDAFKLWCWRRLLRTPWRARRSNQLILKEISSEESLEGLILKLPILWPSNVNSWQRLCCWESLKAEGEEGNRGWDGWMASLTQWTWPWANSRRQWETGKPDVPAVHGVAKSWIWLGDLTTQPQIILRLLTTKMVSQRNPEAYSGLIFMLEVFHLLSLWSFSK